MAEALVLSESPRIPTVWETRLPSFEHRTVSARTNPPAVRSYDTVIGRGKFGGSSVDYLDGTVDQVHLYDRALSAAEVAQLYASGN